MSKYGEWVRRQEILCYEAVTFAKDKGLKSKALIFGEKPPILRLLLNGGFIDFRIREIKSSFVKNVWVTQVKNVTPDINWLIHSKKEGDWLYVSADYLLKKGVRRESDYKAGEFHYVVDRASCKEFKRLITSLKKKKEKEKQKVLTKWFDSPN